MVNSNLVKCAISGCDPSVGRIVGAVGSYLGTIEATDAAKMTETMVLKLGGVTIFENNSMLLDPQKEKVLSDYMFDSMLFPNEVPEHEHNYPHTSSPSRSLSASIMSTSGPAPSSAATSQGARRGECRLSQLKNKCIL